MKLLLLFIFIHKDQNAQKMQTTEQENLFQNPSESKPTSEASGPEIQTTPEQKPVST